MECLHQYFFHNRKVESCATFNESVEDTGLSVYEIIRVEQGIPLFIADHLERLFTSIGILNLNITATKNELQNDIKSLIEKNKVNTGKIKLIVHFDNKKERDLFIYLTPYYFPSHKEYNTGVSVGLCKAIRNNPNAKVLNIQARKKANNVIAEAKVFEVILMDNNGLITEGSRSNLFFIKEDTIFTPFSANVLQGITRKNIFHICKNNNIKLIERDIQRSEIKNYEAAFLSGTSLKILPIKNIENTSFNPSNKSLKKLMLLYNQLIENYIEEKN
ncbi:MAG TPA: aminotransferase class IV [Bacteroidales bacterium]|nr:aminotransferase class IV [Bacteroidales bacterium]